MKDPTKTHPTLRQVQKQMQGFPDELVMYVYHYMNGRTDAAQSYLEEWETEQEEIRETFKKTEGEAPVIISQENINECASGEYASPDTASSDKE